MTEEISFADWLNGQMQQRGWIRAELARRANLDKSIITQTFKRKTLRPSLPICTGIALALGLSPLQVCDAAGVIKLTPEELEHETLKYKFAQLAPARRQDILVIIDVFIATDKEKASKS